MQRVQGKVQIMYLLVNASLQVGRSHDVDDTGQHFV